MKTQAYVYRHYDSELNLLYVGFTRNYKKRFNNLKSRLWWKDVYFTFIEHHTHWFEGQRAENLAIRTENPIHNIMSNPNAKRKLMKGTHEHY